MPGSVAWRHVFGFHSLHDNTSKQSLYAETPTKRGKLEIGHLLPFKLTCLKLQY